VATIAALAALAACPNRVAAQTLATLDPLPTSHGGPGCDWRRDAKVSLGMRAPLPPATNVTPSATETDVSVACHPDTRSLT
jgi:hypothetical protein